jgi:hypothetical protein
MAQILGYEGTVEYVEETTEGTMPTDPTMQWVGLVKTVEFGMELDYKTLKYLPASGETNKLGSLLNEKIAEKPVEVKLTFQEQDIQGFWAKYGLGGTGGTNDSISSISIGMIIDVGGTKNYIVFKGCRCKDVEFKIPTRGVNEVTMTFSSIDNTGFSVTDYIGLGSHATENTTAPLKGSDFTSLTYGGVAFSENVESLSIKASYELEPVQGVNAGTTSGYKAQAIKERTLTAEVVADLAGVSMLNTVKNFASGSSLVATIAGKTLTMANVKFPSFGASLSPTEKVSHTFTSAPIESLTIA